MLIIVINHSYTSTMKNLDAKEVLGNGITFKAWRMALRAKLGRKNVLGHVFHDNPGIRPVLIPIDPLLTNPDAEQLTEQYLTALERWTLGEIEAKNIITQRLSRTFARNTTINLQPSSYTTLLPVRGAKRRLPHMLQHSSYSFLSGLSIQLTIILTVF